MKNLILIFAVIFLFSCKKEGDVYINNITQVVDTDTICCSTPAPVKTIFHQLTPSQWYIVGTPNVNAFYRAQFSVVENLQDSGTVNLFWSLDFFKWNSLSYSDNNFKINYSFNGNIITVDLINATDPAILAYPIFQHQPFWIKIDYIN